MSRVLSHIRIDRVAMTGPDKKTVDVRFFDGVNIIWGASNAGKSFVRRAIDYVFGGEKLDVPPEGIGYDSLVVWLTTPKTGAISLRRSVIGGEIYMAVGHTDSVVPYSDGYEELKTKHVESPNISRLILRESGFREARLLKNERADKTPFSLRTLIRYLIVDETRMIDEKSILLQHNTTVTSEDKSLIKFLLTGIDGSSVEPVRSTDQLKAAKDAKIELLSQLADKVRKNIDKDRSDDEIDDMLGRARKHRDDLQSIMGQRQDALDAMVGQIRAETEALSAEETAIADLSAMILRFEELSSIFASDLNRLSGLEEGGFLLQKFAEMSCPVCGAEPEYQRHDHGLGDVELQRVAAAAEMVKIQRDQAELASALTDAAAERIFRGETAQEISDRRATQQRLLAEAKEQETSARSIYENAAELVSQLETETRHRQLLTSYESEIEEVSKQRVASRQRAAGLYLNIDLTAAEANELSKVIKRVLKAWNYPGGEAVHFDQQEQDIVVDGKHRRNNGAGIRAILHAAFKVALLVYCKESSRPHPGFIMLDSPLLAYRPADETEKYGELTEEELAIQQANLAAHFYEHLQGLCELAQVIVIENHKSDQEVVAPYANIHFTRNPMLGRAAFFG